MKQNSVQKLEQKIIPVLTIFLSSDRSRALAVSSLMLLSGFAGIAYEILYGRILGNILGDQFAVSAAVLITFLLGIGVGSVQAHRLWRYLWLIELGIGLYALLFTFNSNVLDSFLYSHLPQVFSGLGWAIAISVLLLAVPSFLIGCSLPLFAGYLAQMVDKHAFSRAYTLYNFGAALTIIAIEFLLLRKFGLQTTVTFIAIINGIIALGVMIWSYQLRHTPPPSKKIEPLAIPRRVVVPLVIVSVASAIFQLFMVKFAELFLGPFRETFALVLSVILLGIAIGAWLVTRTGWRFERVLLGCLFGLVLMFPLVEWISVSYAQLYSVFDTGYWSKVNLKWLALMTLMITPAICFGATIPSLISGRGHVSRESGYLLYLASLGNVAGFLLMAFVLHQQLDYGLQLLVAFGLVLVALAMYQPLELRRLTKLILIGGIGIAAYATTWDEELLFVSYIKFTDPKTLQKTRNNIQLLEKYKGRQDVFSINRIKGKPYFFINGYLSIPLNSPSERVVGVLSSYFSPRLDQALVLGLGSGATASSVGSLFDHTDVVEINPVVRDNLFRMKEWNFNIEANPRVNIVVDDAIHFTKASNKRYSLILNTVTTPLYFSSSKLYTHEFFQVIRDHLTEDGTYVTWLDGRIGDKGVDIILNTLRQTFSHCATAYIKSSYLLLLCGQNQLQYTPDALSRMPEELRDYFWQKGIAPSMLRYQLLTTDAFALIGDRNIALNQLDYPSLEFEIARLSKRGIDAFKSRLQRKMNTTDIVTTLGSANFNAIELLLQAELTLENHPFTHRWRDLVSRNKDKVYKTTYKTIVNRYLSEYVSRTNSTLSLYQYATSIRKTNKCRAAIPIYQQLLKKDSSYNNANYYIGLCHENLEQYVLASEFYLRELKVDPDDKDASYRLGRIAYKQHDYQQAIVYMKEAIIHKSTAKRLLYLAKAYERNGNKAAARRAYQEALRLKPEYGQGIAKALERL